MKKISNLVLIGGLIPSQNNRVFGVGLSCGKEIFL